MGQNERWFSLSMLSRPSATANGKLISTATIYGIESQYTIRRSSGAPFETTAWETRGPLRVPPEWSPLMADRDEGLPYSLAQSSIARGRVRAEVRHRTVLGRRATQPRSTRGQPQSLGRLFDGVEPCPWDGRHEAEV